MLLVPVVAALLRRYITWIHVYKTRDTYDLTEEQIFYVTASRLKIQLCHTIVEDAVTALMGPRINYPTACRL